MPPEPEVIKHIIEKGHDDWKYSVTMILGPTDGRRELKARGDDLKQVIADIKKLKSEVTTL